MKKVNKFIGILSIITLLILVGFNSTAFATAWGDFHWARTTPTFTLRLGDNVSRSWDSFLVTTSNDWSKSSVLDTVVVAGKTDPRKCNPVMGRVEVCNGKYGTTGWLGIAQIWITLDNHITQATTKLNDTYFAKAPYNTSAWKNLVMCQEVGHAFGLDHQDEDFNNVNLGTCMDYTNDPSTNQHPNLADYQTLEAIYSHLDSTTTVSSTNSTSNKNLVDMEEPSSWGRAIAKDKSGRDSVFERDLGNGNKVITHVFWEK